MRPATAIIGGYRPADSGWHRLGVGWKYLLVLVLIVTPLVLQQPWVTAGVLLLTVACLAGTGLPVRLTLALPWSLLVLLVVLAGFQLAIGQPGSAFVVPGNVLQAVLAARLILCTTPASVLVDALVRAADRVPFLDGERFGLAVGIMLRSIPFLTGAFYDVRDAARARGLERHWIARLSPVVVRAVGFAQATGQALAARGLGEGRPASPPRGQIPRPERPGGG
ncbi:MAG: energy-coupling factor transporter transmembrane protein EcfT [Micropruina sp.]|uniref:energy-coupling factor transporter transmembrane component T family protein n=1 Tax=Micropruina sp. TaxID=2737536 RepID=UPI0039E33F5B